MNKILNDGLRRTSRRGKGGDPGIERTDGLLDKYRPHELINKDICRDDNVYAIVGDEENLINIKTGETVRFTNYDLSSGSSLLRLSLIPEKCYVSDLDIFDALKRAVESEEQSEIEPLINQYWSALIPLTSYKPNDIRRPEIMVTYDVDPKDISKVG